MKRGALRSALSERLREGNLVVVEDLSLGDHKTKNFVATAKALGLDKRALFVDTKTDGNFALASRNVPGISLAVDTNVNIYDVLYHEKIVLTREAVNVLQEKLSK
jgi:large subunit ribosomal protein L4